MHPASPAFVDQPRSRPMANALFTHRPAGKHLFRRPFRSGRTTHVPQSSFHRARRGSRRAFVMPCRLLAQRDFFWITFRYSPAILYAAWRRRMSCRVRRLNCKPDAKAKGCHAKRLARTPHYTTSFFLDRLKESMIRGVRHPCAPQSRVRLLFVFHARRALV